MTGQQRVTDEQLTEWEADARRVGRVAASRALALIADLRASRALEAEHQQRDFALHAEIAKLRGIGSEEMRAARALVEIARAERHGLQQRINNALAGHHEYLPPAVEYFCCAACNRASNGYVPWPCPTVAALTGTDTDHA